MNEAIIIGAGLAGLSCGISLTEAGVSTTVLEAGDAPGGRVRTDTVEGFRLDRGFQVLLTAYPEAKRLLDYRRLELKKFNAGALVWRGGRFHRFADPFRDPLGGLQVLIDPMLPFADKRQVAKLRAWVKQGSEEEMFARVEQTTRAYLRSVPFSSAMIDAFFEPFFGGVFLERDLVTSSRFFEFLFRMFAEGVAAVPARGMEQIPLQLAAKLPPGVLQIGTRVSSVTQQNDLFAVQLEAGETLETRAVVLAVPGNEGNALLKGVGGWPVPEVREWNKTTAFCYAAAHPPIVEPIIMLNGEGRAAGPVNNVAVMSAVSAHYAPPGAHLIVASVVGEAPEGPAPLASLEEAVRTQLQQWFGPVAGKWKRLAAYPLAKALPRQTHAEWEQAPVRLTGAGALYLCGDYRETASIQGALASGRRAAEALLEDQCNFQKGAVT